MGQLERVGVALGEFGGGEGLEMAGLDRFIDQQAAGDVAEQVFVDVAEQFVFSAGEDFHGGTSSWALPSRSPMAISQEAATGSMTPGLRWTSIIPRPSEPFTPACPPPDPHLGHRIDQHFLGDALQVLFRQHLFGALQQKDAQVRTSATCRRPARPICRISPSTPAPLGSSAACFARTSIRYTAMKMLPF